MGLSRECLVQRSCGYLPGSGLENLQGVAMFVKTGLNSDWELRIVAMVTAPRLLVKNRAE